MHESLGDRRNEVQGARFIYFVKQLQNNLSWVRKLPQESLSHEPVTRTQICDSVSQSRSTPTSGPPKVSARAPAHRSYHFRGVKLKSCIKKIHHNLYIIKQASVRIKHADTEGASHKKFGTDARVQ